MKPEFPLVCPICKAVYTDTTLQAGDLCPDFKSMTDESPRTCTGKLERRVSDD